MSSRLNNRPYKLRQHKKRAIDVEFDFIPGKRISTRCWDMAGAVLFAEDYLRNNGLKRETQITLEDFSKNLFTSKEVGSIYATDRLYNRVYPDSYYKKKQAMLDNYILPTFGKYLITAITARSIEIWLPSIRPIRGSSLSDNTKNKILVVFRDVMKEAKKRGYRDDNPAEEVCMIKERTKERNALPAKALLMLFPSNMEARIKVWGSAMWAVYFSILYDTGMRPGEIAALRVSDVYSTARGLAVGTARSVDSNERLIKNSVKTTHKGRKERGGLLYSDTAELLMRYIEKERLHGDDMLFRSENGKDGILFAETSNKHFKLTLKKLGLYSPGQVQYCLRHNYTTNRRGDMPDDILALSMGHTKLRDDYDHQNVKDLIRRLDAARDSLFENRERLGKAGDIVPLEESLKIHS